MSNGKIKTLNELHIYIDGKFEALEEKIDNIKKVTFWVGSLTGGIVATVISGIFKIFGGK